MDDAAPGPRVGLATRAELTAEPGLDFLLGMISGRHPAPPFSKTTSIRLVHAETGLAIFEGDPSLAFYNPLGVVQGGWASSILDAAMGCAIHTVVQAGHGYTTVEMKINFVRPLLESTGTVRAEGRLISAGSRIATSEGRLVDGNGKLIAHGTETCLIFPAPPPRSPQPT